MGEVPVRDDRLFEGEWVSRWIVSIQSGLPKKRSNDLGHAARPSVLLVVAPDPAPGRSSDMPAVSSLLGYGGLPVVRQEVAGEADPVPEQDGIQCRVGHFDLK